MWDWMPDKTRSTGVGFDVHDPGGIPGSACSEERWDL